MKLTLLILILAVSMATATFMETENFDDNTEINSLIESLLQSVKQQQAGIHTFCIFKSNYYQRATRLHVVRYSCT